MDYDSISEINHRTTLDFTRCDLVPKLERGMGYDNVEKYYGGAVLDNAQCVINDKLVFHGSAVFGSGLSL